jgi:FkbM family methyltransferase
VDIGAHIGTFAIRAAKKVSKGGRVIAIEPEPITYEILIKNISLNKLSNVLALNYACDIKSGSTKLFTHGYTGSSICFPSRRFVEVKAISLSKLVISLKIKRIDYLKINAEGAELSILKGMSCWEKVSKVVIASHHYAEEAEEIQSFLRRVGFKTLIVQLRDNTLVYAKR